MVSTSVLVTVVLAAFAVMATAITDRLSDEVSGLRSAVAGLDARVATLEQR